MAKNFPLTILPFDGNHEMLKFFFEQIDELATVNRWTNAQTLMFAKSKLTGPALTYFIQNPELKNVTNLTELQTIFTKYFAHSNQITTIHDFNSIIWNPNESVVQLAHKINTTMPLVYPGITDKNARDEIKLQKLLQVIPNDYRVRIFENNINTYDAAVEKTAQLFNCIQKANLISLNNTPSELHELHSLKTEVKALKDTLEMYINKPNENNQINYVTSKQQSSPEKKKGIRENRKYNNSWYKHQNRFLPFRKAERSQRRNNRRSWKTTRRPSTPFHSNLPTCQICSRVGHAADVCWYRSNGHSANHRPSGTQHRLPVQSTGHLNPQAAPFQQPKE